MSDEDVTKGTRYFNALREVADAARNLEEARVRYEDTLDRVTQEKIAAEKRLREALSDAAELTGESLPESERDKERRRWREESELMKEKFRDLEKK